MSELFDIPEIIMGVEVWHNTRKTMTAETSGTKSPFLELLVSSWIQLLRTPRKMASGYLILTSIENS